jgi:Flp pilus assembly pilin Flp
VTTPQDPFSTPPGDRTPPPTQGYGQGYGQPGSYGSGPADGSDQPTGHRNGIGTAALVVGVVALLTSWLILGGLLGIVAVILGVIGLGRVKRREASNRGSAIAGVVLGVLSALVAVAIIAAGAAFFTSDTFKDLAECLEQAGPDPAAQQECQREAEQNVGR